MDSTSRRRTRRSRAAQRGVSLIEGMTASVVLLIGLVGVFQGVMVASRQNSMANRATRASGIASQVRMALDSQGRARVIGAPEKPGLLGGDGCTTSEDVLPLAGGLESLEPEATEAWAVRCILDLDAREATAQPAEQLLPSYSADDGRAYRRVLVAIERQDVQTGVTTHQVAVVVSWLELGQRRFVRQYLGFYDAGPFGNETNVEI